jgi:hypothetical protein
MKLELSEKERDFLIKLLRDEERTGREMLDRQEHHTLFPEVSSLLKKLKNK